MSSRIDSPEYWIESFEPSRDELEALQNHVLETMTPVSVEALASRLIHDRVDRAMAARKASAGGKGVPYVPSNRYEKGQTVVFGALDGETAKVSSVRPGDNDLYGDYEVFRVKIGGETREFAAGIGFDHELTRSEVELDADEIAGRYAPVIAPRLREVLDRDDDWAHYGDRWILRAVLPTVNAGHRNLAEAIVMLAGEPTPASRLLEEIELDAAAPAETRTLALELSLDEDERFRNVGALESPLWALDAQR